VPGAKGRRKLLAGILTISIGIGAFLVIVRRDAGRNVPLLNGSTITVTHGIHLLGELGPAAAYVVETSEGLVLIDSGLDSDARPLKAQMEKLGLDWKKTRAILLTHMHVDHCGGAEHLREATGATVYAGAADAPYLRAGGPRDALFSTFNMPRHAPHPTTVDAALEGPEILEFGNVRIRVLSTPGHTLGSTCYLIERAGLRVLFAGDVIQRLDEPTLGTYSTYLAPRYRGDARSFLASLEMLRALPVPDVVLPGHPNASAVPRSPRMTQQHWANMLDSGIDEMRRLVDRYATDGENFLDGHPKRLLPDLYYLGDFHNVAVYVFFAASKLFVVNAPGGPGLSAFLATRLRELGRQPAEPTAILLTACSERETAGLEELVSASGAHVFAAPADIAAVRQLCPPETIVASAYELSRRGWFPVTAVALGGPQASPIAYLVDLCDKNVLFSGTIPAGIDPNSPDELLARLAKSRQNAQAYHAALVRLATVRPDLWLPAVPYHSRNANLYGNEWVEILEKYERAALDTLRAPSVPQSGQP